MKNKNIMILLGPNINIKGTQEKGIYGGETADSIKNQLISFGAELGLSPDIFQSNWEGALIDDIHKSKEPNEGFIINAGALAFYSYALRDAISCSKIPCIEVNTANIYAKESFRHNSVIAEVCVGQINGFGKNSYLLAMQALRVLI